jgi:soluble lytic murein transglycosylase-like protein
MLTAVDRREALPRLFQTGLVARIRHREHRHGLFGDLEALRRQVLSDAFARFRKATCRQARDLLWDGAPRRAKVELTLWRQSGAEDVTQTPVSGVSCHERLGAESAFRLKARVIWPQAPGDRTVNGPMALGPAVARAGEVANAVAGRVLQSGEQAWITLRMTRAEKRPRRMVRALARRYGVGVATAVHVAACESGFNPRAYSHPYAGIYQQDVRYWPGRARHYGHPGASPFDAFANVDVSLQMARSAGWGHWGCA